MKKNTFPNLANRSLSLLIVVLLLPGSLLQAQQTSTSGPPLLTYADLVALYENDTPSTDLQNRLTKLLTTPFVNNSAGNRSRVQSSSAGSDKGIRIAAWNIERGLEFDAVKAALTNDQRFSDAWLRQDVQIS